MGYEPKKKTFNLLFEGDSEFDGLQVRTGSPSLGALRKILSLSGADEPGADSLDPMISLFAELLIDWNVTNEGEPVPATEEGLNSQDTAFVFSLIKAWGEQMRESVQVPAPLDERSTAGSLSAVPSTPLLDDPSRSQAS